MISSRRIILLVLLWAGLSLFAEAQINLPHFIRQGRIALYNNNYTGAIESFNIVIERKKDPFEEYFFRGLAKYNLGDYQGAEHDFSKTLEIHPFYYRAYHYRGVTYAAMMEKNKALMDLSKALELDPYNAEVLISRGAVYLQMKQFEKALKDYDESIMIDDEIPLAYLNSSIAYKEMEKYPEALERCSKAVEINILYKPAYAQRGLIKYDMGWHKEALLDFNQAIKLDKTDPRYFYFRAITRYQLGNIEGTLSDYGQVLKLDPTNALTYYNRAILYSQIKEYNKAINDLDHVAILNPNNVLTYFNRAHLFYEQERYDKSIEDYSTAIRLFPKFARAYFMRSAAKQKAGDTKGAYADRQLGNQILAAHDAHDKENNQTAWIDSTYFQKIIEFEADFRNAESMVSVDNKKGSASIQAEESFCFMPLDEKKLEATGRHSKFVSEFNQKNSLGIKTILWKKHTDPDREKLMEKVLEIESKISSGMPDAELYMIKGIINHELQNYTSAISDYTMAIITDKDFYPAYINRAQAIFEMKMQLDDQNNDLQDVSLNRNAQVKPHHTHTDYTPVIKDLNKILSIDSSIPETWYNRGNAELKMKDFTNAVQSYTMATQLDSDFAEAYYNRGLTLIYLQDRKRGCTDMSKAGELGIEDAYRVIKKYCNE